MPGRVVCCAILELGDISAAEDTGLEEVVWLPPLLEIVLLPWPVVVAVRSKVVDDVAEDEGMVWLPLLVEVVLPGRLLTVEVEEDSVEDDDVMAEDTACSLAGVLIFCRVDG